MKVTRQSSMTAEAVQWQGTSQSLQEIQALIAPASPYYGGDFDQKLEYRSLGVPVAVANALNSDPRLDHVSPGGWVVKDGPTIMIMTDDQFRRSYRAQASEPPPMPECEAILATHPRALATVEQD